MKIRLGVFCFLLGITALAAVFPPGAYGQEKVYTVQKGETLYSIARTLGIKADDLMKFNGITDPARLQAGQSLKIPGIAPAGGSAPAAKTSPAQAVSGAGGYTIYRVVRGDTFFSIARKFSVTVELIRKANSLSENYLLKEGDSLRIPTGTGVSTDITIPADEIIPPVAGTGGTPKSQTKTDTKPPENALNTSVRWPVAARDVSYMTGKLSGVVITAVRGESVKSLTWGTVLSAGPYRGFGKVAIIQVEGGYLYVYGGCESLSVKEGDKVGPGTELGILGTDVVSNKPQLFFMVYRSNTPIDPAKAPRA